MKRIAIIIDGVDERRDWYRELSRGAVLHLLKTDWTFGRELWVDGKCEESVRFSPCPDMVSIFHGCFSRLRFILEMILWLTPIDLLVMDRAYGVFGVLLRWLHITRRFVSIHSAVPFQGQRGKSVTNWCCYFASRFADEVWVYSLRIPYGKNHRARRLVRSSVADAGVQNGNPTGIFYLSAGSPNHALDILFDISLKHNIPLHLVGSLNTRYHLAKMVPFAPPRAVFHGYLELEALPQIASKCFCGWAVYSDCGKDGFEFYGFPAKYLRYLSLGLPMVTTNVSEFSEQIELEFIGKSVEPTFSELEQAVLDLRKTPALNRNIIRQFSDDWNWTVRKQFRQIRYNL